MHIQQGTCVTNIYIKNSQTQLKENHSNLKINKRLKKILYREHKDDKQWKVVSIISIEGNPTNWNHKQELALIYTDG